MFKIANRYYIIRENNQVIKYKLKNNAALDLYVSSTRSNSKWIFRKRLVVPKERAIEALQHLYVVLTEQPLAKRDVLDIFQEMSETFKWKYK